MKRLDTPELLDEHDAPAPDMQRSLRDLRRINRYLGGLSIYRRSVQLVDERPRSVLDLGAGTADGLDALPGRPLRIALDFKIDHLLYLREGSPTRRVVGDASKLPFRDASVDVVTSGHFFHHFTPDENARILGEALRVSRKGVAVNDTRRHLVPLLFISLLGWLRLVGRITRFDGPASVRRAYELDEARAIASQTGAPRFAVKRFFPFRFGILLWR
ncbi:MAG TPA: methyltransferase domain-containing protein [Thermoanaerobaculia bacterium]|jgi:hypothetical protein